MAASRRPPRLSLARLAAAWLLAGAFGLLRPAAAMEFSLHQGCVGDRPRACGPRLLGAGPIVAGDATRLRQAVQALPAAARQGLTLTLSSPGGNLVASLELGRTIRALGLDTYVGRRVTALRRDARGRTAPRELAEEAQCLSGCAYAFLGGVEREVEPGATYGLHGVGFIVAPASAAHAKALAARAEGLVVDYLREMGVEQRVAAIAASTPSHGMAFLDRGQRRALRVENAPEPDPPWTLESAADGTPLVTATLEPLPGAQVRVALRCLGTEWRLATTVLLPARSHPAASSAGLAAGEEPGFVLQAGDTGVPLPPRAAWEFLRSDRHAVWMAGAAVAPAALAALVESPQLRLSEPRLSAAFGWPPLALGTRGLAEALPWVAAACEGAAGSSPQGR